MEATISTLLERAQGLFSRGFVLSGLLPAILFFVLNVSLALWVFPANWSFANALVALSGLEQILFWALMVLAIYVLGLVLAAINPWLTRLLEGGIFSRTYLPVEMEKAVYLELFNYEDALDAEGWMDRLKAARAVGQDKAVTTAALPLELRQRYETVKKLADEPRPVPFEIMEELFTALEDVLQQRPAPPNSELAEMVEAFYRFLQEARRKADYAVERFEQDKARQEMQGVSRSVEPGRTRLSRRVVAHRDHTYERFGMDVELFWPRLLKFARADADFYPLLEDVKSQLDFSIAVTFVIAVTTLAWMGISLFAAPDPIPYIVVSGLGIPLALGCYQIVLESYVAFTRTAQAALDLYRFDLLRALHVGLPDRPATEQQLWKELSEWVRTGRAARLRFSHSSGDETRIVFPPGHDTAR